MYNVECGMTLHDPMVHDSSYSFTHLFGSISTVVSGVFMVLVTTSIETSLLMSPQIFRHYYYECNYFSLSPKDASLMYMQWSFF